MKQNGSHVVPILVILTALGMGGVGSTVYGLLLLGIVAAVFVGMWRLAGAFNHILFRRDP